MLEGPDRVGPDAIEAIAAEGDDLGEESRIEGEEGGDGGGGEAGPDAPAGGDPHPTANVSAIVDGVIIEGSVDGGKDGSVDGGLIEGGEEDANCFGTEGGSEINAAGLAGLGWGRFEGLLGKSQLTKPAKRPWEDRVMERSK